MSADKIYFIVERDYRDEEEQCEVPSIYTQCYCNTETEAAVVINNLVAHFVNTSEYPVYSKPFRNGYIIRYTRTNNRVLSYYYDTIPRAKPFI